MKYSHGSRALTRVLLAAAVAIAWTLPALAQPASKGGGAAASPQWIYPAVPGFGGVHPRPDLPVRPDPGANYHVFVDVVSNNRDPAGHYQALQRLARLVNLMAYAKVPPAHVHIVALLDGEAGYAALTNAAFRRHFGGDNPNLAIVHALKKAGVKLLICSQALAERHIPDSAISSDVTITLSALTDAVVYGHEGYTYMQL